MAGASDRGDGWCRASVVEFVTIVILTACAVFIWGRQLKSIPQGAYYLLWGDWEEDDS